MKKIKILLVILSLFIYSSTIAQDTLIVEDIDNYDVFEKSYFGPNSKHFLFIYQTVNIFTPSVVGDQYSVKYLSSYEYFYGIKYKLKIFKWFSNGISFNYNIQNIKLKEQLTNGYPENMNDKIIFHNFGAEYFWRFSIGKNGNTIGKYIDFGVWEKYMIGNRYTIKYESNNPLYSSNSQKEVYKGIDLFNPYTYGASFRFGSKQFAFVANYTISDVFSQATMQTKNIFDLPKLSVGIEIAVVN
ncbi:MAG: hypothetical protein U9Q83_11840 [Bacteroidota bacterium]|nr:hypothetical protein [Bacteroidota bacterium]